jgi:hypothetical protein
VLGSTSDGVHTENCYEAGGVHPPCTVADVVRFEEFGLPLMPARVRQPADDPRKQTL